MAIQFDRESIKSESPELLSVSQHARPAPAEPSARTPPQPSSLGAQAQQKSLETHYTRSSSQSRSPRPPVPSRSRSFKEGHHLQSSISAAPFAHNPPRGSRRSQRNGEDLLHPIDLDTSSFDDYQHIHRAKRPKLGRTSEESSRRVSYVSMVEEQKRVSVENRLAGGKSETKAFPSQAVDETRRAVGGRRVDHHRKSLEMQQDEGKRSFEAKQAIGSESVMDKTNQEMISGGHTEVTVLAEEQAGVNNKSQEARTAEDEEARQLKQAEIEAKTKKRRGKELDGQRAAEDYLFKKRAQSEKAMKEGASSNQTRNVISRASRSRLSVPRSVTHRFQANEQGTKHQEKEAMRASDHTNKQEKERRPVQSKPTTVHEKTKESSKDVPNAQVKTREALVVYPGEDEDDGSVSTWSSEDENKLNQNSNGAFSRVKTAAPAALIEADAEAAPRIDFHLPKSNIDKSEASIADWDAASTSDAASSAEGNSISRSPARYRFKTKSSISGSDSASGESVDSDPNSESDSLAASSLLSSRKTSKVATQDLSMSPERAKDPDTDKVGKVGGIEARVPLKDGDGWARSTQHSSMHSRWPMTLPATNSADVDEAANAELQLEDRASMSPAPSPQTTTNPPNSPLAKSVHDAELLPQSKKLHVNSTKSKRLQYPKFSEMMQVAKDSLPQSSLSPSSVSKLPIQTVEAEYGDENSSSGSDENSDSDGKGPGISMLRGLRTRTTNAFGFSLTM